jgi:hypothetical protein
VLWSCSVEPAMAPPLYGVVTILRVVRKDLKAPY